MVVFIFFDLFLGLIYRFWRLQDSRLKILIPRIRVFDRWIFYGNFVKREFDTFFESFVMDDVLVYFLEYWGR